MTKPKQNKKARKPNNKRATQQDTSDKEPILPRLLIKVPRVVPDQKAKFMQDQQFRELAQISTIRYAEFQKLTHEERKQKFLAGCRDGHCDVSFLSSGTNLQLFFRNIPDPCDPNMERDCDFDKEPGKVHLMMCLIMNGVCVRFRGWIDLERLDGEGQLEYDEQTALLESKKAYNQVEQNNALKREYDQAKVQAASLEQMQAPIAMPGWNNAMAGAAMMPNHAAAMYNACMPHCAGMPCHLGMPYEAAMICQADMAYRNAMASIAGMPNIACMPNTAGLPISGGMPNMTGSGWENSAMLHNAAMMHHAAMMHNTGLKNFLCN